MSEAESLSEPEPTTAAPGEPAPSQEAAPARRAIRCVHCGRVSASKFCPGCGRSYAEREAGIEEALEERRERDRLTSKWLLIREMLGYYVGLLALNFIAAYVLSEHSMWSFLLADLVLINMALIWMFTRRSLVAGRFGVGSWVALLAMPVVAVGTCLEAVLANHLVLSASGLEQFIRDMRGTDEFFDASLPLWALILSIAVIPGIFEEIFFRGMVQGTLEKVMNVREAWWVQAIIFAIAHVNPLGFFTYLVFMGLILGWVRNRTGSLVPGMLLHFCHNLYVVLGDRMGWF